jgi:hypothetical protein
MYAGIFWTVQIASAVVIVVTFIFLAKARGVTIYDIALFIAPFMLWLALLSMGLRPKSLSNLFEPFLLIPFLAVCFLLRAFAFRGRANARRSLVAFLIGLAGAIAIYAFVPLLPE